VKLPDQKNRAGVSVVFNEGANLDPESKIAEIYGSAATIDPVQRERTPTDEELDSWAALRATGNNYPDTENGS
jgi:hypothetical protein